jgi:methylphosphotriester-DNA--protein-cysteine methyltransferase
MRKNDKIKNRKDIFMTNGKTDLDLHFKSKNILPVLEKIINETYKNFSDRNFTIERLCEKLDINYNHVNALCWENLNMSPLTLLENVRLEFVLTQLNENGKMIREISAESGFPSFRTFRNVFKKRFGKCATQFIENLSKSKNRKIYTTKLVGQLWEGNKSKNLP